MLSQRLGDLLLERQLVGADDIERAVNLQERIGGRLGAVLLRTGSLSEDTLLELLAEQLDMSVLGQGVALPDEALIKRTAEQLNLSLDWLIDQQLLLWEDADGAVHCAARDPLSDSVHEVLRYFLGEREVQFHLARAQDLDRLLDQLAKHSEGDWFGSDGDIRTLREMAEEAPVVELVNNVMAQAVEQRASDIHVEPEENNFAVRFRIDGVLHTKLNLPRDRFNAVASRLKLISNMDIAERRLPQDGRLSTRVSGQELDIRVSALPGVHGESIVMRLLPKERKELGLERLGFAPDHLQVMKAWMQEAHGIVLVTGPTGSGKSTTLYAALDDANDGLKKMITVEDPVEFQLPRITQIQTHAEIGLTFARALRSILRQDPDVVMIGEIRDLETAEIAIQAALTGHLVLSTLHTNDAISAFTRLIDMGVEPFLVATPLKGVQAQRLVRKLCEKCARPADHPPILPGDFPALVQRVLGDVKPFWREAVGCPHCQGTGYRGRLGIYELVPVSVEMQQLITSGATVNDMKALAKQEGHRTLREDGLLKAWQGITTIDEVLRVTGT